MKILFYHYESKLYDQILGSDISVFVKSTSLYLKTYLEIKKPDIAKQLQWCVPQQLKLSDNELIELLNTEKPDIFCTTHYIWNYRQLLDQLNRIKPLLDFNVLFLAGGPSVDVNVNPNYFVENDFIDYAFYGPGEGAFSEFIDCLINKKPLLKSELTNMAWPDNNRNAIVAEYEYVPQLKTSPYLHNKEFFKLIVDRAKQEQLNPIISYELTRGCPYACTFCDWNSGFGNKTTRRKDSYKDEIDLFEEYGATSLFLADANLGQYQEDVDMIEYLAEKNVKHNAKFKLDYTVSKLKKENNLKIFHTMAKSNLCTHFVISVQDSNEEILQNIDRPDVGWAVHTKHIRELSNEYPHIPSVVQLIQGLPGQTVESWRHTLSEVTNEIVMPFIYVNELVPASPAARSSAYNNKWNFVYSDALRWDYMGKDKFRSPFAKQCSSFTEYDFIEMTLLSLMYTAINQYTVYTVKSKFNKLNFDADSIVDVFLQSKSYRTLKDNLTENWIKHNQFYFTVDMDNNPTVDPMAACSMPLCELVSKITSSITFLKWTLAHIAAPHVDRKKDYAKHVLSLVQKQNG